MGRDLLMVQDAVSGISNGDDDDLRLIVACGDGDGDDKDDDIC